MSIAVIGTGSVGGVLGRALARAGKDVVFGSREPDRVGPVAGDTTAKVATVAEALAGADTVVLAQPGSVVGEFVRTNAPALDGLLLIDATNNLGAPDTNAAAAVADHAPGARYARAFNTYGWEVLEHPVFDGTPADLVFSATEADRPHLEDLIRTLGFRPAYLGPNQQNAVDALLPIWFGLAVGQDRGRHLGFRVLED
jgi:8-hydroxy-5-deazaflavin:NADPH oxidoreductase